MKFNPKIMPSNLSFRLIKFTVVFILCNFYGKAQIQKNNKEEHPKMVVITEEMKKNNAVEKTEIVPPHTNGGDRAILKNSTTVSTPPHATPSSHVLSKEDSVRLVEIWRKKAILNSSNNKEKSN